MSKIEVDAIVPQSGTTLTVGESGDTITIPSGATFDASNATTTLPSTVVTTTGTQTLTNKTIDASQLTGTITPSDATVTPAKLAYNYNQYRNIIINGDMSIAQRGTSTASITSSGYYTVDRFQNQIFSAGTWTLSQDTDVPTGQGFSKSLKYDCTTANASLSAGSYLQIVQRFEGQNLQYLKKGTANAESLTLSFWVKSNKTGTYIAELLDNNNNRSISKSYTVNTANTWEKKTITIPGDTAGALTNDNNTSLLLVLWLGGGSTYTSGTLNTSWNTRTFANIAVGQVNLADNTANNFWITGVQLETGTTASDFEFLPYDVNLARCQRYCQKFGESYGSYDYMAVGTSYNTNDAYIPCSTKVTMRANPSFTLLGSASDFRYAASGSEPTPDAITGDQLSENTFALRMTDTGALSALNPYRLYNINSTGGILLSAEL
jgi:hypothetical protein